MNGQLCAFIFRRSSHQKRKMAQRKLGQSRFLRTTTLTRMSTSRKYESTLTWKNAISSLSRRYIILASFSLPKCSKLHVKLSISNMTGPHKGTPISIPDDAWHQPIEGLWPPNMSSSASLQLCETNKLRDWDGNWMKYIVISFPPYNLRQTIDLANTGNLSVAPFGVPRYYNKDEGDAPKSGLMRTVSGCLPSGRK